MFHAKSSALVYPPPNSNGANYRQFVARNDTAKSGRFLKTIDGDFPRGTTGFDIVGGERCSGN